MSRELCDPERLRVDAYQYSVASDSLCLSQRLKGEREIGTRLVRSGSQQGCCSLSRLSLRDLAVCRIQGLPVPVSEKEAAPRYSACCS